MLQTEGHLAVGERMLEYRWLGPRPEDAPTLVLLHEGLGCVGLWRDFPERLAAATGCGVFAYSRAGYGSSSGVTLPRPLTYLHDEADEVLPALVDAIGLREGVLVGHSDGASIAAIHLGRHRDARVRGAVLIAPHFIVEDVTIAGIREAKRAYESGELRGRLARWHADVDVAFRGWCDAWLDPAFRSWDIRGLLPSIGVPVHVMQGENDEYATLRQVDLARTLCGGPTSATVLPGVGHAPHREAAGPTLEGVATFAATVLAGAPRR